MHSRILLHLGDSKEETTRIAGGLDLRYTVLLQVEMVYDISAETLFVDEIMYVRTMIKGGC